MYGSITQLEMKSEQDLEAAVRGLEPGRQEPALRLAETSWFESG
jgi:hypothetical protein